MEKKKIAEQLNQLEAKRSPFFFHLISFHSLIRFVMNLPVKLLFGEAFKGMVRVVVCIAQTIGTRQRDTLNGTMKIARVETLLIKI